MESFVDMSVNRVSKKVFQLGKLRNSPWTSETRAIVEEVDLHFMSCSSLFCNISITRGKFLARF